MGSKAAAAEPHFTGSTVPFALAAGLSGVVTSSALILVAGLAETSEHYQAELERERYEIQHVPDLERAEVREVLAGFGLKGEPPDPKRARNSAATIGFSYIAGGAAGLRRSQGPLHRSLDAEGRTTNRVGRRPGRQRSLPSGEAGLGLRRHSVKRPRSRSA